MRIQDGTLPLPIKGIHAQSRRSTATLIALGFSVIAELAIIAVGFLFIEDYEAWRFPLGLLVLVVAIPGLWAIRRMVMGNNKRNN